MDIHEEFIDQLSLMKKATVGDVIEELGLVQRSFGGKVIGVMKKIEDIIQIFYTVDYLIENKLVEVIGNKEIDQPDFIYSQIMDIDEENEKEIKELNDPKNKFFSYTTSMPLFIKKYWGRELLVETSYFKMIQNGYKTDLEKKEIRNYRASIWIPVSVAILASLLTSLFTVVGNLILQNR